MSVVVAAGAGVLSRPREAGPQFFPYESAVVIGTNNGSGLLIDPDHVLTAGHVVNGFGVGTTVVTKGGSVARVAGIDVGSDWKPKSDVPDVGVYSLDRSLLVSRVRVDCSPLVIGQRLYAISSQYWIGNRFLSEMTVASLDEKGARYLGKGMVLVQSNFWPGMSGSPVFNERGELVGVVDDMLGMPLQPDKQFPVIGFGYGGIAGPSIICAALRKIHFFQE